MRAFVGGAVLLVASCGRAPLPALPEPDVSALAPEAAGDIADARGRLATASDDAALAAAAGDLAMAYDNYSLPNAAAAAYERARALAPGEPRWPHLLGQLRRSRGEVEEAAALFDEAAVLLERSSRSGSPEHVAALVAASESHLVLGNLASAWTRVETARSLAPADAAVLLAVARVLNEQGRHQEAADLLQRVAAAAPRAHNVRYALIGALRSLGDEAGAEREMTAWHELVRHSVVGDVAAADPFRSELRRRNRSAASIRDEGDRLFEAKRYAEAIEQYRRALTVSPGDATTRANLAAALSRDGDTKAATEEFRAALALMPSQVNALIGLAELHSRDGLDADAATLLADALTRQPDNVTAHFNLANTLTRLDRFEEAAEHYARAVELSPGDPAARRGLARALSVLSRWKDARQALESGLALRPQDSGLHQDLARLLAASPEATVRDGRRAMSLARRALEASRDATSVETLAMAQAEMGDVTAAASTQRDLVVGTERAGDVALAAKLRVRLADYDAGRACRVPWTREEATASPSR